MFPGIKMSWTSGVVAKALDIDRQLVKTIAWKFSEYLSPEANPKKGAVRRFNELDTCVLAYASFYWEDEPDIPHIEAGLNRGEHLITPFCDVYRMKSPLFREPPDEHCWSEELASRSLILNDSKISDPSLVAQSYRHAGNTLIENALRFDEAYELDYPIFYIHRHCLELYLKLVLKFKLDDTHSLSGCINLLEEQYEAKISKDFRRWLEELNDVDKKGETFRYADDRTEGLKGKEYWVDLSQFKAVMNFLYDALEDLYKKQNQL